MKSMILTMKNNTMTNESGMVIEANDIHVLVKSNIDEMIPHID